MSLVRDEAVATVKVPEGVGALFSQGRSQSGATGAVTLDERRYRSLVEATAAIVWNTPESGELETEQPGWGRFTGQTNDQYMGWGWINAVHPEDRPNTARVWSQAVASRTPYLVEHRLRRHDGEYRHMSVHGVPILTDGGAICEWVGVHTDITEQKQAEEALRQSEERFRESFDFTAVGMALASPDGHWIRVNHALCAIVGLSEAELLATSYQGITHPDDIERSLELARRLLAGEIPHFQIEKRYLHKLGHAVWVLTSVSLVRDALGRPVHFVAQVQDIALRKRTEEALAERASLAELGSEVGVSLTQGAPLPEMLQRCAESLIGHLDAALARIWMLDVKAKVLVLQASAGIYTRRDGPHGRIPVGRCKIGLIAEERRPHLDNAGMGDPQILEHDSVTREGMIVFAGYPLLVDDRILGVMAVFSPRPFSPCCVQVLESIANGIALAVERKQSEGRLAHQAMHDGLTGLPNRTLLLENIERSALSGRRADARFGLLLLDLDRFKEINDTFGHHYGDEVLKGLNPRLRGAVRETDLVARLGGDEFGVLLADTDENGALRVADRILASLAKPITVEGRALDVGASIGIALYPAHGTDSATLLQRADVAMYAAKRNRVGRVVYAPDLTDCTPRRLALVGALRRAIEGDQLLLHYQPKIDLKTMRVGGVEALVRWLHPGEGLIAPGEFIPIAEQTGLIRPLGLWVLNRAMRQCREWHEAGLELNVAMNLSPENLHDGQLIPIIQERLEGSDVPPQRLTIEITETAMMNRPARAKKVLDGLHEMGIRISIDDFGTGYSSLAFLRELSVDEVKVDRSFVKDMLTNDRDSCIVRAVIDLGHNLSLKVVAEGVEDQASLDQLASWGCDSAQGYYFSQPLAAPELETWMAGQAGTEK